jgi:hypothetical protein
MAYERNKNGRRFLLGGMNLTKPPDLLGEGEYGYLQNVRARKAGRITGRPPTGDALFTLPAAPNCIARMNDSTTGGYIRIIGAAGVMYVNNAAVASGFSGNPLAILPFGPDQSVQPWAYIGDSSQAVTVASSGQACTGMIKVRSDGLTRKTGIKEPQAAPLVTINTETVTQYLTLPANTPPWTNIGGVNSAQGYGGTDNQPPFPATIMTPIAGATVTLTVTGSAYVNVANHAPGDPGPSSANYPGDYITSPKIVVFAFTDADGNIIAQSTVAGAPPVLGNVGASASLVVPQGASQLQIGINSQGGTFAANTGAFSVQASVSTSAVTQHVSIVGQLTAFVWGDSPHTGAVANYIWKNPNDGGAGVPRITSEQYTLVNNAISNALSGIFGTAGTQPTLVAPSQASSNSLIFDSSPEDGTVPVSWTTNDPTGTPTGSVPLYSPALESEGYQDFNTCIAGSIFIPQGGTYAVQLQYKDQIMFGVGGGATSDQGKPLGSFGQSITVVSGLPLMFVSTPDGTGSHHTTTIHVTFPATGLYPIEIDWDYWYHTGRSLIVEMAPTPGAAVAIIPPQPQGVRTNVQYWAKYRASETGAPSNPSPPSAIQYTPVLANQVSAPQSPDPQVDKIDYYRADIGLANATYVATGPNDAGGPVINGVQYATPVEDTLSDLAAANNQLMAVDDFEPFPSIDTPKKGMVTIIDGVVTWKSGDQFNIRWLPGTLMLIGSPTQMAYSLTARPISTTQIVLPDAPDTIGDIGGDGVPYNIAQPILAQQPMPSMWGPDAYGFMHACGDTNQPNAYKWTKAYNPDSAPQANTMLLTSPSETLMGGDIVNGVSMVFSSLRAWLMFPNFADAQAITEGIIGNPWHPIPATVTRGLHIRNCLCSLGGKSIAYRAPDGICLTNGGPEASLTDETLYNLFPHENFTPVPVPVGPCTVYPPDDTKVQSLAYQNGYIYYDYTGTDGSPHTLVFDEAAKGWSVDVGVPAFTAHAQDYAPGLSDTVVGCVDGSVRLLQSGGTEAAVSVVATGADNAGDARSMKRIGDVFIKAIAASPIAVALYSGQYASALTGYSPATLAGGNALAGYILDWGGVAQDVNDIEAILSWPTGSVNEIDLWQPTFLGLPLAIMSRVTEGLSFGMGGYGHAFLCNLMYAASAPVTLALNTDQGQFTVTWPAGGTLAVPVKLAVTPGANKFKVCSYAISSSQSFFLFDLEVSIGQWGRDGAYEIVHPFRAPEEPGAIV